MEKINVKKIIEINRKHGGTLVSRSNLDFAIDQAKREKNIYRSNAHIVRGILHGHPFLDGNKRTTTEIVLNRFKESGIRCDEKSFSEGLVSLAKNNVLSIQKIERRLRKWCPKK